MFNDYVEISFYRQTVITGGLNVRLVNANENNRHFPRTLNEYSESLDQLTVLLECKRALRKEGIRQGRKRLRRLITKLNLKPKAVRRFRVSTYNNHSKPVVPNILDQQFTPYAANIAWASDITFIRAAEGRLYLHSYEIKSHGNKYPNTDASPK